MSLSIRSYGVITLRAVFSHCSPCFSVFYKLTFCIFVKFLDFCPLRSLRDIWHSLLSFRNRPFPSPSGPLHQNEVKCSAFDIEVIFILMQVQLIFTWKVGHLASFWKWGFLEVVRSWPTTSFPGFSPTRPTGRREPWERGWMAYCFCSSDTVGGEATIRELKQRRQRRQRGREKSKRFRFWQNNNFASASRFLNISMPSLHDYDVKVPNFTFCRGHHKTWTQGNLSFSFPFPELWWSLLEFN